MAIKFTVKTVRLNVYIQSFPQSDDLDLHSRSQLRLKLDKCLTCTITAGHIAGQYLTYGIKIIRLPISVDKNKCMINTWFSTPIQPFIYLFMSTLIGQQIIYMPLALAETESIHMRHRRLSPKLEKEKKKKCNDFAPKHFFLRLV